MNNINQTSIIFNQNLKNCIAQLHELNPSNCISNMKKNDYKSVLDGQENARKWFMENQFLLNIENNRKLTKASYNYPNFYALLCANVCDLNRCRTWEDVSLQIAELHSKSDNIFCDFDEDVYNIHCSCGHIVCPDHTAMIKINNMNIIIACDCLEKTGIMSKAEFKRLDKPECYNLLHEARLKRNAERLRLRKIRLAREARESSHRQCLLCKEYMIPNDKPEYFKYCGSCYHNRGRQFGVCLLSVR